MKFSPSKNEAKFKVREEWDLTLISIAGSLPQLARKVRFYGCDRLDRSFPRALSATPSLSFPHIFNTILRIKTGKTNYHFFCFLTVYLLQFKKNKTKKVKKEKKVTVFHQKSRRILFFIHLIVSSNKEENDLAI